MRATEGDNLNHSYRDVKCLQSDLQVRYVVLFRANDKLITQNTPLTDDVRAALLCMTPQRVYSECDNQSLIVKRAGFVFGDKFRQWSVDTPPPNSPSLPLGTDRLHVP